MSVRDITGDIGPLLPLDKPTILMYSFDRPARILWQAVFEAMIEQGCTEDQAIAWLKSKEPRWCLDGSLGNELKQIGRQLGQECAGSAKGLDK